MPPLRVGITPDGFVAPADRALRALAGVELTAATPAELAHRMRAHTLDAALLSPLDLARDASLLVVMPGPCVLSRGNSSAITVHFREGLHGVRSLAADPARQAEIVLARIILREEFDLDPVIVPVQDAPEVMLDRADAALLTGDPSMHYTPGHERSVDLVELWGELTDLPYVHGVLCARPDAVPPGLAESIAAAAPPPDADFTYAFDDSAEDALAEYFRYAYYHGMLPDVPEIALFGPDRE